MKIKYLIFILLLVLGSISVVQAGDYENAKDTASRINESLNNKIPYRAIITYDQIVSAGYVPKKIGIYGHYLIDIKRLYYDEYNGTLVSYINIYTKYNVNDEPLHNHYYPIQINNPIHWYMPFNTKLTGAQASQDFLIRLITYADSLPYGNPINDDTALVYPSIDGYAEDTTSSAYSTLRADTGAAASSGQVSNNAPLIDSAASDPNFHIFRRGILSFNTSSIPDDSTINSANLSIFVTSKENALGSPAYGITGGTLADNTAIAAGDYDGFGNTRYASDIAYASLTVGTNNNWSLNAAGLANVSKTGFTVIYLRDSWDIDNSAPTYSKSKTTSMGFAGVANATSSSRPFLQIVYTPAAPVASFTKSTSIGTSPLTVTFTDTSSAGLPILSWFWVFGDGSTTNNTQQNPIHTFNSAGTYNVNLTITNSVGSNTTATQTVTVTNSSEDFDPTTYGNWTDFWVNSTSALTDFQISMILDNRTGTSSKTLFYTNGTTRSDWADVVWTDTSNNTLSFWNKTKSDTATNTTWWIKVPSISNDNTTKIRLFYGNASKTNSYNNGTTTFQFFDDFPGTSLDTTKWSVTGNTPTVSNSIANFTATPVETTISSILSNISYNNITEGRVQFSDGTSGGMVVLSNSDGASHDIHIWPDITDINKLRLYTYNTGPQWTTSSITNNGNYNEYKIERISTTSIKAWSNTSTIATHSTQVPTQNMYIWITCNDNGETINVDYVFVRKYAATEPFLTLATTGGAAPPSAPVASFTLNRNPTRIPNAITATDTSTNTPTSWQWSWGDGSSNDTTQNPSHTYTKRGRFNIILTATNAGGSGTNSATYVRVVGYENYY